MDLDDNTQDKIETLQKAGQLEIALNDALADLGLQALKQQIRSMEERQEENLEKASVETEQQ
jgi:hypothetical protein